MTTIELIRAALKEDMPLGDVTTESLAVKPKQGEALLKAKEDLVLSGANVFEETILFLETIVCALRPGNKRPMQSR